LFENFPRISKLKFSLEQAHQENFARLTPILPVATAFVLSLYTTQRPQRACRLLKHLQKVEILQFQIKQTSCLVNAAALLSGNK